MNEAYRIEYVSPSFNAYNIRVDSNYDYALSPKIYSCTSNYIEVVQAFIHKLVSDSDRIDKDFLVASETSLSDWLKKEEDEAWAHL